MVVGGVEMNHKDREKMKKEKTMEKENEKGKRGGRVSERKDFVGVKEVFA